MAKCKMCGDGLIAEFKDRKIVRGSQTNNKSRLKITIEEWTFYKCPSCERKACTLEIIKDYYYFKEINK